MEKISRDNLENKNQSAAETPVIQPVQAQVQSENTAPVEPVVIGQVPTQLGSTSAVSVDHSKDGKGRKRLIQLLLTVILLAVIGAAGWAYWQQSSKSSDTPQSAKLQDVDMLRIGSTEGPLGGIFPSSMGSGVALNQSRQIYEGLVGNEDRQYVPLLAESWTNPDQKTWVFKLKPNIKFHTGKVMKAQDVKTSLEAIKELDFWSVSTDTIDTVEVINDQEIKITTTEPDSLLLNRLALAYIHDTAAPDKNGGNNGTGPYTLTSGSKEEDTASVLTAYDGYHKGRPTTRKIEYKLYESEELLTEAVQKNEVDYAELLSNASANPKISSVDFNTQAYETPGVFGIYMNIDRGTSTSPLKNAQVRKAIALAINREEVIKEVQTIGVPATQVIPKSLPGHDPNLSYPSFNREDARKTLLSAFPQGVTFEYIYFEGVQPDAPVIIKQLREAGFTIVERAETDPAVLTQKLKSGKYDLFSASYSSDLYDSRDLLSGIVGVDSRYAGYKNDAKYEQLLNDSDKEFDPTKRIALLREANNYIAENYLWVPVRKTSYTAYYKKDFDIKVDYNDGSNLGVYFWKVGRKTN